MQQPKNVYKQTFGAEFGAYQRGGSGVGYFGNGIWFFMNADLDAILYIPAEKLLTGTSSADAVLQTKISSLTIDYANGQAARQTTVAYNGIFKATKIGETMQKSTDRFKQILREMWKHGIRKIIVERIWVTGDVKPRRIERKFHDHYEDAAPEAWVPNDRTTIKIDENEADDLFVKFMMGN
jgi:hypothetical protein